MDGIKVREVGVSGPRDVLDTRGTFLGRFGSDSTRGLPGQGTRGAVVSTFSPSVERVGECDVLRFVSGLSGSQSKCLDTTDFSLKV